MCIWTASSQSPPTVSPNFTVLVFTKTAGFRHDSIPAGIGAIQSLGREHGFAVEATEDAALFNAVSLAKYRVVVFLSTTGDILDSAEQAAFESFIRSGKGFVGIHSATDTEYDWPWYGELVGAYFADHPAIQAATTKIVDVNHPSTEPLPLQWSRTDEWYNFRKDPSPNVKVLVTIDETTYSGGSMGEGHPLSWYHEFDGGRSWYTAMGHTTESYSEPLFLAHMLGGILWAANLRLPLPLISDVVPTVGAQGVTIPVSLIGSNLSDATSVAFSGSGIAATIQPGGTSTQIQLLVKVALDAAPGARSITVTTPAGVLTVDSIFSVQRANTLVTTPLPITDVEHGGIRSGYIIVTPDANSTAPSTTVTYGIVRGGVVQSQAGIIALSITTDASLFAEVVPGIGRNLGVAFANPSDSINVVTMTLRDIAGRTVGTSVTVSLQPNQQLAKFLSELFSDTIGAGFQGSLRMQSSMPVSILGLRFSGIEFSTLPVANNGAEGSVPSRTLLAGSSGQTPTPGVIGGSAGMIFPQFAMGGGWATQLAFVNNSGTVITGRFDIFDTSGTPMAVRLNSLTQSTFIYSIPPGGTLVFAPRDPNGQSPM